MVDLPVNKILLFKNRLLTFCYFKQTLNLEEFKDLFHDTYFLLQFSEFPDPMLCSDYVQLLNSPPCCEQKCSTVSWEELKSMDLPSFEPAFLVLCRVLLNVIHECLKLRLEQRPAGEPSLLSIKQVRFNCFWCCFFLLYFLFEITFSFHYDKVVGLRRISFKK